MQQPPGRIAYPLLVRLLLFVLRGSILLEMQEPRRGIPGLRFRAYALLNDYVCCLARRRQHLFFPGNHSSSTHTTAASLRVCAWISIAVALAHLLLAFEAGLLTLHSFRRAAHE